MKKGLILAIAVLSLSSVLHAQSKVGTAGLMFLEIAPTARVAGMGEAFVAIADDASALFYNPAGAAWIEERQLLTGTTQYPADIYLHHASLVYPISEMWGTFGISSTALTMDRMLETTVMAPEGTGREFGCYDGAVQISWARKLTTKFSSGISFKWITESLADEQVQTIAGDIGTMYETGFRSLRVGMMISNFGPDIKYLVESFPLPMNFKVGLSFEPFNTGTHRLIVDAEGSHPNHNVEQAIIGGEYSYKETLFLRGGYKIAYDAETWSVGAGFRVPLGAIQSKLDVSYTDFGYLQDVKRVSLNLLF